MSDHNMLLVQDRPQSYHHYYHPSHYLSQERNLHQQQGQAQPHLRNWLISSSSYSTSITPTLSSTVYNWNNSDQFYPHQEYDALNLEHHLILDRAPSTKSPRTPDRVQTHVVTQFPISQDQELMQSAHTVAPSSWNYNLAHGQLTPNSARTQKHHYRESSFSSIGSAGPESPYNHSTASPQIILPSDSAGSETYYDGLPSFDQTSYYNCQKPLINSQTLPSDSFLWGYNHNYQAASNLLPFATMQKHNSSVDESMQPPDFSHSGRRSVASTQDSPPTPPMGETSDENSVKNGESFLPNDTVDNTHSHFLEYRSSNTIPKLDRTMSDVYNDELYSPTFAFSSAPTPQPLQSTILSPSHSDVFTQRLQAANSQHLSASTQQPVISNVRDKSPFRQGSPLAPTSSSFASPQVRLGSAQQMREQQKAENDARALQKQIQRSSADSHSSPKTISPKDALLDYHETEEDASRPLFPPQNTQPKVKLEGAGQPTLQRQPTEILQSDTDDNDYASMATSRRESTSGFSTSSQSQSAPQTSGFSFVPPSVPGGVQVPQQYPFVPQQKRQASNLSAISSTPDFPSTLTSMESSSSEYAPEMGELKKPAGTMADSGTYTCTYHGCTLRFETPTKLQKHKREGHRQSAPLTASASAAGSTGAGGGRSSESASPDGGSGSGSGSGMTSAALLRNSQAGPHKCERINPSTGKPCNTIFSRPYDLTRHEDTIHNARKQKVRCHLCTEEKTFSRNDALTRHMRVVHPEVDFPGKTRRRVHD